MKLEGKYFNHQGERWFVVGMNQDGSFTCTNGKEKGAFRFTREEVVNALEKKKK